MLRERYNARRDNVIDLCKSYLDFRAKNKISDGVDTDILSNRIKTLKEGKFIIAVVGEVKAGKSTFINALLSTDLLPSGSLQATSAIVEIFKSDKFFLKIKYASGRTEEVYDDLQTEDLDKAKEKLKVLCSISDEYRELPTSIINEYIVNYDSLEVTDDFIAVIEERSGLQIKEYKDKLHEYLLKFNKDNIASEIQIGYPFEWKFSELRLVDTPGVNASGGFEDITFKFINNANAIIFVKNIKPVESRSFQNFFDKYITDRSREVLFLVLTHTIDNLHDKDTLLNETRRLYGQKIKKEKIIAVDSILKQIYDDISKGKTLEQIKRESPIKKSKIPILREIAEDESISFEEACIKYSGFRELKEIIDRFSDDAPNLQLLEILDKIKAGYDNQLGQYNEKIDRLRKKAKDPQTYEREIKRIKEALDSLQLDYNQSMHELNKEFKGKNTLVFDQIEKFYEDFKGKIELSNDINELRTTFANAENEAKKILQDIYNRIEESVKYMFQKLEKEYKGTHNITIPAVDLDKIEKESKEKSIRTEKIIESVWENWNWLKLNWTKESRTRYIVKFDKSKQLQVMKSELLTKLKDIKDHMINQSRTAVDDYRKVIDKEFRCVLDERKRHLDEESKQMQTNEQILNEIRDLKQKKTIIMAETKKIIELREDIA